MPKIRFGILSTAGIAQSALIPATERAENAETVAIASSSGRAGEVAAKFDIPKVYESYEALLDDPEIDAVYIPLPNHLHMEWVKKAAEKGKHVLSEKPAALNVAETKELVNACKTNKVKYMEAFMYQFHSQHDRVKEIIASGEIGEVQLMRASFSFYMDYPEENIRMNPLMGGGCLYDIGSYCIHSIRNILEDEPENIFVKSEIDPNFGVDTTTLGMLEMKKGVKAMFDCSFNMPFRPQYEVVGTKGVISVPRAYRPDKHDHEGLVIVDKEGDVREERIVKDQYKEEVEHFAYAILNDTEPRYTGEDTIKNMQVIDWCYDLIKMNA
ncbi:Gfo/Idh/MocA family protein [Salinibacillus xinjiangensis]|uniref:Gfo/Idh/MocA family oxidoreductase n=1 Tax=Salinibacillus xinjiangensis TaxID=1229268 RepID=A0A6G1X9D4_9BACI|nr:Gfo/Idh/MocA family oxidoreductase [Salinibacillus xinjiangensis]MRG87515.1 gfo/Idh/MocA family oxidoreductase [Salinibacillus xinjiangensis]